MSRLMLLVVIALMIMLNSTALGEPTITVERFLEVNEYMEVNKAPDELEQIIRRHHITESNLQQLQGISRALYIKEVLEEPYENCYTYLYEEDETNCSIAANEIKCFAVTYPAGIIRESLIVDLSNDCYYYDPKQDHYENSKEYEIIGSLSGAKKEKILKLIDDTNWSDFERYYGNDSMHFASLDQGKWVLAFETIHGVVRYTIQSGSQLAPESLIAFGRNAIKISNED